jgi:hypothetical protein
VRDRRGVVTLALATVVEPVASNGRDFFRGDWLPVVLPPACNLVSIAWSITADVWLAACSGHRPSHG